MTNLEQFDTRLEGYDWECAFQCCGNEPLDQTGYRHNDPAVSRADPQSTTPITEIVRSDVAEILGMCEGDNDGPDWLIAGKLKDGRWFMLRAGCDYTGWDCRSEGNADVADDKDTLLRLGMTEDERNRLSL